MMNQVQDPEVTAKIRKNNKKESKINKTQKTQI